MIFIIFYAELDFGDSDHSGLSILILNQIGIFNLYFYNIMCAYAFFRDNYIGLPKDITDYIILFVQPCDDDVTIFKLFVHDGVSNTIKFQYNLYNDIMTNHRWHEYRLWTSFIKYMLRIKGNHHRALMLGL